MGFIVRTERTKMCSAVEVVGSVRVVLFARLSVVSVGGRRFLPGSY
jgi:hypothetical protein